MAETYWPAVPARTVNDLQFDIMVGAQTPEGLVGLPTDPTFVFADGTGRQVKFRAERYALLRGKLWYSGTTDVVAAVAANASGSTRIDLPVIGLDRATWVVSGYVKAGTPGAGVPPTLEQVTTGSTGKYEIAAGGAVTVVNGAVTLNGSDVQAGGLFVAPGSYVCTSTTRPAVVRPGMRLHEIDTGRGVVGVGGVWMETYGDTGWVTVDPSAGWSGGATLYRRHNGMATLMLSSQRIGATLSSTTNSQMFVLPWIVRPTTTIEFAAVCSNPDQVQRIQVITGGGVTAMGNSAAGIASTGFIFGSASWPVV